jgi:lysine-ketoglutarate reductase/saccharopine dehydrogenase-like protein (TIGR00300 family)
MCYDADCYSFLHTGGDKRMFRLPAYNAPDFSGEIYKLAPCVRTLPAPSDGTLPEDFYATTIYPEYFKIDGEWKLIEGARMDCCAVIRNGKAHAVEARCVRKGDEIVVGRAEDLSNGVYIHTDGFRQEEEARQAFAFRTARSRETSSSQDYDFLCDLLRYEREKGYVVWVLGPAVDFDRNARSAMAELVRQGYADAVFAGNALATHDLEAALFHTGLGQDIYTKELVYNGHYNHLDAINRARRAGSIENLIREEQITDGILAACTQKGVPYVLAGSIRDDGPLPGVISDVYEAQNAMRVHTRKATTVIGLATQLHSIATGNMTPSWRLADGNVRPVYFYTVDISEFAGNKLHDRGSLCVKSLVTNVQDFLVNLTRRLMPEAADAAKDLPASL